MLLAILTGGTILFLTLKLSSQYERKFPGVICNDVLLELNHNEEMMEKLAK